MLLPITYIIYTSIFFYLSNIDVRFLPLLNSRPDEPDAVLLSSTDNGGAPEYELDWLKSTRLNGSVLSIINDKAIFA